MDNNIDNSLDNKILDSNFDNSVVSVKPVVNKRNYKKKKHKQNGVNNAGVILGVSILLSFVCGAIGAYLITSNVSVK